MACRPATPTPMMKTAQRLERSGRRHHHRKDAINRRRGHDHRDISGEAGLRAEHVHFLRERDARQHLKADRADTACRQRAHDFALIESIEQTDMDAPPLKETDFVQRRLAHPQDDVGGAQCALAITADLRARSFINLVRNGNRARPGPLRSADSAPSPTSRCTPSGTNATRLSPLCISRGTKIRMIRAMLTIHPRPAIKTLRKLLSVVR